MSGAEEWDVRNVRNVTFTISPPQLQHLMSQHLDPEEQHHQLHTQREAITQRIQLLTQQNSKLKADVARFLSSSRHFLFQVFVFLITFLISSV